MNDPTKLPPERREELRSLQQQMHRLLEQQPADAGAKIELRSRRDGWYELEGRVQEPRTKRLIMSLIPAKQGAQRIVDRIRVGRLAKTGAMGAP